MFENYSTYFLMQFRSTLLIPALNSESQKPQSINSMTKNQYVNSCNGFPTSPTPAAVGTANS